MPLPTTFTAHSSYGDLVCDIATGEVIHLVYGEYGIEIDRAGMAARAKDNTDEIFDIVRMDVAEWQRFYPELDLADGHDILTFGFWDLDGRYYEPDHDWRRQMTVAA